MPAVWLFTNSATLLQFFGSRTYCCASSSVLSHASTISGRALMKSSRIAIAPASEMPNVCPVATMRAKPSPTMSPMRETEGSHSTAASILPARRFVAMTSID